MVRGRRGAGGSPGLSAVAGAGAAWAWLRWPGPCYPEGITAGAALPSCLIITTVAAASQTAYRG